MKIWSLLLTMFMLFSFQERKAVAPEPISDKEVSALDKEFLLDYYERTREPLEEVTQDLDETQLQYQTAEDRWSVSQVLEHIILTEQSLFGMTQEMMSNSPTPERKAEVKATDDDLIMGIEDRSHKFKTSAELEPTGKYSQANEALEDFEKQREEILEFIKNTPEEEMRNHISDSPFGAIDGYQSLLFLAAHTARHTKQIEEVLADPGFPSK